MKALLTIAAVSMISASAYAAGGATKFECRAGTYSGRVVTVSGCVESNDAGTRSVACENEEFEYITIRRDSPIARQTPDMVETVKIPGRIFQLGWQEESFRVRLTDSEIGSMNLSFTGGERQGGSLDVAIGAIQHQFRVLGCTFTR